MRITLIISLFFALVTSPLNAQTDSTALVKYSPEYRFQDGIFLNFNQVKNNKAIPASRIRSNTDPFDMNFFKNLVDGDLIIYFDEFGTQSEIKTSQIWGFSQDGKLYINYNGEFNRIPIVGSIGHFIADVTVYENVYDPYYRDYYDSYYYRNSFYNRSYPRTTRSKEMRQYLVNFQTGEVSTYSLDQVKNVLMEDPVLYDEFVSLRKRKQKDLMFFFIRRFNEKYPLYLPAR